MSAKSIPARPDLEQYKKQAKDLLKTLKAGDPESVRRLREWHPRFGKMSENVTGRAKLVLADVQLVIACEHGFETWAKFAKQVDVLQFFAAIHDRDSVRVTTMLKHNPSLARERAIPNQGLDYFGWDRMSPLFYAVELKDRAMEEVIRAQGTELDVFETASLGRLDDLRTLLAAHPELANASRDGAYCTPLHCCDDKPDVAMMLLEAGADPNLSTYRGWLPLHGRAEHGDVVMVKLLLEHGADPNATSHMGTPLHAAVGGFNRKPAERWREACELLVEHGADVNKAYGNTPLTHAAWRGHYAAIEWLLDHGANSNQPDGHGRTALEMMLKNNVDQEVPAPDCDVKAIELLLRRHGAKERE